MANLDLLLEAEKRGLLPPEKIALLTEARSRGLVPPLEGTAQVAAPQTEVQRARGTTYEEPAGPPLQQEAWNKASTSDIAAGLPLSRAVAGIAKVPVGIAQLGVDIATKFGLDPKYGEEIALQLAAYNAKEKRGMEALGNPGANLWGLAGSVLPGVGLASKVPTAVSMLGKIGQSAAAGGTMGLVAPSETAGLDPRLQQAGVATILGAATPPVASMLSTAGKTLYRVALEPKLNPAAIMGRSVLETASEKAPEILNALRSSTRNIVPGSLPTAGEAAVAAGRPEWSAMQQSARQLAPTEYLAREEANKAAQLAAVRTVSGTPQELAAKIAARKAQGAADWSVANAAGIDPAAAAAFAPQIQSLMQRPAMLRAQQVAKELAREKDITLTNFGSVEGLDWLKKGLDNQISAAAKSGVGIGKAKLDALLQTKQDLLSVIDEIAPALGTARTNYAAASLPINQAKVGQYLEQKLVPALGEETGALRANAFATATRDAPQTIKKVLTEGPRYQELKDVLNPTQLKAINEVEQELARSARNEMLARRGGITGPDINQLATRSSLEATGGSIPNPLSRTATIMNAILDRLHGKIDKKLAKELAIKMLDPTATAAILKNAMQRESMQQANKQVFNQLALPIGVARTQNYLTMQPTE